MSFGLFTMQFFRAVKRNTQHFVAVGDVVFIFAKNKYLELHSLIDLYYIEDSLTRLEKLLPQFIRIHRNCLVNEEFVLMLREEPGLIKNERPRFVVMQSYEEMRISRRYYRRVKEWAINNDIPVMRKNRVKNPYATS